MRILPFFFSLPVILSSQQPADESFLGNLAPIARSIHEERGSPMDYAHRKGLSVAEWRRRCRAEVQRCLAYAPKPAPPRSRL